MPRQATGAIAALWLSTFKDGFSPRPLRRASKPSPPRLRNYRAHLEALSQLLGVAADDSVNKDTQRTAFADRHSAFDDRDHGRSSTTLDLRRA